MAHSNRLARRQPLDRFGIALPMFDHGSPSSRLGLVTDRKALTLIELMVVVALLTILATFSLGAMRGLLRSQKVTQASTLVKQYLQNAQIRAISNGRPVAVYLDRVSMAGDSLGASVATNYMVTRLQLGEVFPPYIGDVEGAMCKLERYYSASSLPNHADVIIFDPSPPPLPNNQSNVISGFGYFQNGALVPGFIRERDILQIEGSDWTFEIGDFKTASDNDPMGRIVVPLFNNTGMVVPQLPFTTNSQYRRFRVYRQPTKSLVGSISLPRGTCIDMSLSGLGPTSNGCEGGSFALVTAPSGAGTPQPADFSRVGIVFDAQGRFSYLMDENSMRTPTRIIEPASSTLYVMVGRTDQVLPGLRSSNPLPINAALQSAGSELPPSNLLDTENVWISCNPFTGEIKSSPVTAVVVNPNPDEFESNIRQARQAAIAGLTN